MSAPPRTPLCLYASALARDAALDGLSRQASAGAVWADEHLTLAQFLVLLDRRLPDGAAGRVLEGGARFALLSESWDAVNAPGRAAGPTPTPGGIEALGALLGAWKGAGLAPEAIERAAGGFARGRRQLAESLRFVSRVYGEYERRLSGPWTDREGWERAVLGRLRQAGAVPDGRLSRGRPVRVSGLFRLVPFRRTLLAALAGSGHPVEIVPAIPLGDGDGGCGSLRESFGELAPCLVSRSDRDAEPAGMARIEAPTPYSEVYEIGRRVRDWLEEGLAPEEICVAFRNLGPYSQIISDVFRRLNIPYYERRGEPLAFQPIARVALAAMDAALGGLEREGLFRFLCAGPLDVARWTGIADAPDPARLHRLALDARVDRFFGENARRPEQAWRERLSTYLESAKQRLTADDAELAARAVAALTRVINALGALRAPRPRAEFAQAWRKLWAESGLTLTSRVGSGRETEALALLDAALDEAAGGPGAAEERVSLEHFVEVARQAVAARAVRFPGAARAGGVRVLNLYDLQGLSFERLVCGGMNSGVFPVVPAADPLLGDAPVAELRSALLRAAPGIGPLTGVAPRPAQEAMEEERALWVLACRAARGRLLVTRTQRGLDGELLSPSVFWNEVAAHIEVADSVRPAPPLPRCVSGEEAELRAAWVLGGGPPADGGELALASALLAPSAAGRLAELSRRACVEARRALFFQERAAAPSEAPAAAKTGAGGPYDGVVVSPPAAPPPTLRERFVAPAEGPPGESPHRLAPSDLETMAQCPFRFLAQKFYGVADAELPEEELSGLGRGSLWHEILGAFYGELLDEAHRSDREVVVLEQRRRAEYAALLKKLAGARLDAAPHRHFTGRPGLWRLQRERLEAGLTAWLECELRDAQRPDAFRPACVEFDFGPKSETGAPPVRIPVRTPAGPGTLCLTGRLDRLDLRVEDPAGGPPRVTGLRLLDYKISGEQRLKELVRKETVAALLNAQLPVYLLAAIAYLRRQEAAGWRVEWDALWSSAQAAYYCLREIHAALRGRARLLVKIEDWPLPLSEFLTSAARPETLPGLLEAKVQALLAGRFPVLPAACGGANCPARYVCRFRDLPVSEEPAAGKGGDE